MREDPHGTLIIDVDGVLMLDIPGLTRPPLIAPPTPPSPPPVEPPTGIADATVDSDGVIHFPDGFFVVRVTMSGGILNGIDVSNFTYTDGQPVEIWVNSSDSNHVTVTNGASLVFPEIPFQMPTLAGTGETITLTAPAILAGRVDLQSRTLRIRDVAE
jgi:hypothetical protein